MKKPVLSFLLIVFTTFVFAQQRGVKPLHVEVNGKQTKLYDQSHALVIGISAYTNGWPKLPGVKKDVVAVKSALEKNDFHVVLKENLTKSQMNDAFVNFIEKYGQGQNNRLLFYFAGHGHTVKTSYGEILGYVVPVDAPNPNINLSGFRSKSMPMSRIEEYAKLTQSKHALFLFDACFSGSLFALSRAVPEVIRYKTIKPVRQFITSGSEDETVPDKSIFREQFVTALTTEYADANDDHYLTGTELGKFLQDNVVNYSRNSQHPQYGKIRNPYLDKGDFVFILNTGGNTAQIIKNTSLGKVTNTGGNDNELSIGNAETTGNNDNQPTLGDAKSTITYGSIALKTEIAGTLYIDGKRIAAVKAHSNVPINNIISGKRLMEIKGTKENWRKTVTVSENYKTAVNAKSSITYGSIELNTEIAGTLYIDGKRIGSVKANSKVPINSVRSGSRKLEIKGAQENWVKTLTIYKDKKKLYNSKKHLNLWQY